MEGRVDRTPNSPGLALYETSMDIGSPLVSVTRFSPPQVPQTISHSWFLQEPEIPFLQTAAVRWEPAQWLAPLWL